MLHDPIEDDLRFKDAFEAAELQADAKLADDPRRGQMGFCFLLWWAKQRILKEKYGIDWKTPSEMNPDILFD